MNLIELYKEINSLKQKNDKTNEEIELLEKYQNEFNLYTKENTKAFHILKEQIINNVENLDFNQINSDLYDINFVEPNLKQTIYEFTILQKNEKIFTQLFNQFEDTISLNSLGYKYFFIIELISFLGFSSSIIERVFKKMEPTFIAHYRNKIIYLQSLLKKENIDAQNLFDFYLVLGERVEKKIFNSVTINAYSKFIIENDEDDLEELIQDYRTVQYLNRIFKMLKPKKNDPDYGITLMYLTIIFYELNKAIEIIKKEEEEDKKEEEEAKKAVSSQNRIEELPDDVKDF